MRSKTDDPKLLEAIWNQKNENTHSYNVEPIHEVDEKIKSDIDFLLDSEKGTTSTPKPEKNVSIKFKDEMPKQNSILSFKMGKNLELRCIYNLFSNFGNVSCIVKKKDMVSIKFRTLQFAAIANSYLNGKTFYDNYLNLRFDSQEILKPV